LMRKTFADFADLRKRQRGKTGLGKSYWKSPSRVFPPDDAVYRVHLRESAKSADSHCIGSV
jgi:hypothetical protein